MATAAESYCLLNNLVYNPYTDRECSLYLPVDHTIRSDVNDFAKRMVKDAGFYYEAYDNQYFVKQESYVSGEAAMIQSYFHSGMQGGLSRKYSKPMLAAVSLESECWGITHDFGSVVKEYEVTHKRIYTIPQASLNTQAEYGRYKVSVFSEVLGTVRYSLDEPVITEEFEAEYPQIATCFVASVNKYTTTPFEKPDSWEKITTYVY